MSALKSDHIIIPKIIEYLQSTFNKEFEKLIDPCNTEDGNKELLYVYKDLIDLLTTTQEEAKENGKH